MTDHSLHRKGNVASGITRGFLSNDDEDGTPYAQDSPLTTSWLLSKQQEKFCRIPPIYEPLVKLAVNGFCRTFKGEPTLVDQDCSEMLRTYLHHIKT